jgi:hypothetical protein
VDELCTGEWIGEEMKMLMVSMVSLLSVLFVTGCMTTDERLRAAQASNVALKAELEAKAEAIRNLSADKESLTKELDYCSRRGSVLVREKDARLDEESVLRRGIREFTEQIQVSLQTYYQRTEIVDYLGSEIIMRGSRDARSKVLLVDLNNTVRENGTIIGGRAWLTGATRLSYCLLRQEKGDGKYRVVTITPEIVATESGRQNWVFDVPMGARKGDLIGVYVADTVTIPYDDVDTGNVVTFSGAVEANASVTIVPQTARNKRTYSFGVVGYFDSPATSPAAGTPSAELPTINVAK